MGMMESPQAFIKGLGKGTGSLLHGVASGVLGSAASVVGTATGGMSQMAEGVAKVTNDEKYMRKREEKQRQVKASQGGALIGMKTGGESFVTGVTSGLTGLVTKPYEEGKKSGALGVVKGMGYGLLGVATKPIMGVTDGISNMATGFSQQLQDPSKISTYARPQRALAEPPPPHSRRPQSASAKAEQRCFGAWLRRGGGPEAAEGRRAGGALFG